MPSSGESRPPLVYRSRRRQRRVASTATVRRLNNMPAATRPRRTRRKPEGVYGDAPSYRAIYGT